MTIPDQEVMKICKDSSGTCFVNVHFESGGYSESAFWAWLSALWMYITFYKNIQWLF